MKKLEFKEKLIELLKSYFENENKVEQMDFDYDRDENCGEIVFRTKKKDVLFKIKL